METEYEVRILDIDVEDVKKRLKALGCDECIERSMRRYVYDIKSDGRYMWIRLRDNGEHTTLTIKEIESDKIDGTKETEVIVNDFNKTKMILSQLGFEPLAYQENKRISYKLEGVDIEIDFWPKIPAYLEVEGKSVEEVRKVVEKLGFKMEETTSIGVRKIYKKYGLEVHDFKELKFE